jgi:hypothetical protein
MPTRDNHSSLLWTFLNYEHEKVYKIGPRTNIRLKNVDQKINFIYEEAPLNIFILLFVLKQLFRAIGFFFFRGLEPE